MKILDMTKLSRIEIFNLKIKNITKILITKGYQHLNTTKKTWNRLSEQSFLKQSSENKLESFG